MNERSSTLSFILFQNAANQENIDAHVIVFSVTDKSSFRYSEARLREVRVQDGGIDVVVILVANKEDLVRNRMVNENGN